MSGFQDESRLYPVHLVILFPFFIFSPSFLRVLRASVVNHPFSVAHDVVAAIDVQHLSGDAAAHGAQQEHGGVGHFLGLGIPAQGGAVAVVALLGAEPGDAAGGRGAIDSRIRWKKGVVG